jgi:predicted CoA-binding protein
MEAGRLGEKNIRQVLERYKTVAVVGLSRDQSKASYVVAEYLKRHDFRIIPVNPFVDEVLGEKSYRSLLEVPEDIQKSMQIVDIFRPANEVSPIIEQIIQLRKAYGVPFVVWMQLGIVNEQAAEMAREAGLTVIMDRCMKIEHQRLRGNGEKKQGS